MIVNWDGRDWQWRPDHLEVGPARVIRDFTGKGLRSWMAAVDDGEPDALVALWWAIQEQNGVEIPIESIESSGFKVPLFLQAVIAAAQDELRRAIRKQAGVADDPKGSGAATRTPKRTRTSATTGTGTSSF